MTKEIPIVYVAGALLALVVIFVLKSIVYSGTKSDSSTTKAMKKDSSSAALNGAAKATAAEENKNENAHQVTILYGTQTGTAERFSKELAANMRERYGSAVSVSIVDIEQYAHVESLHKEKFVFLLMATYGDGEPTDNAAKFYDWLVKGGQTAEDAGGSDLLKDVSFGVFGLGNRQYEHFNAVGKKADKALQSMGAHQLVRRGDGDDDQCIEDDFAAWKEDLWNSIQAKGLFNSNTAAGRASLSDITNRPHVHHTAQYDVETYAASAKVTETDAWISAESAHVPDAHHPVLITVTGVRELHTPKSDRSCVHVDLDISGTPLQYVTGDHIALFCENSAAVVDLALKALHWDGKAMVDFRLPAGNPDSLPAPIPGPLSLRRALTRYADLLAVPRKAALLSLAEFAQDETDKAKLRLWGSPEGRQEYQDHIAKSMRSLLEILQECPSVRPPVGAFFGAIAPRLQPRYYSISSSSLQSPTLVTVTCAVVKEKSPTGREHLGVCSNWLKGLQPGARVPAFIRHSTFRLPSDPRTPIVMVGPGTGLAPFRGFLLDREVVRSKGGPLGPAKLFFGCRERAKDFIYEEELRSLESAGVFQLSVAFSREKAQKEYVQHHVARDREAIVGLLDSGAYFYVCGDAKHMAKDVHSALIEAVREVKGISGTQAEGYVQKLHDSGRYLRDVW